jgi:organic radical activating enzyme
MKSYRVKSIFGPTLQGEGMHAGLPCLFVRLAGCNAWDGKPETRAKSACPYCDTDFLGGESQSLADIAAALKNLAKGNENLGCVLSGGEPLLQADEELLGLLGKAHTWVDIETNGTRPCPDRPRNVFISCSPKRVPGQDIAVDPDWWKLLIPDQESFLTSLLAGDRPIFLQPTCPDSGPTGAQYDENLKRCVDLCVKHGCRLSLQLHKYLGVP